MKHVLITGESGLVASNLIYAIKDIMKVHTTYHKEISNEISNVYYHKIDFSKPWDVKLLPTKIDTIIHLSQSSKFRDFPNSALNVFKVNIESTAKLLDYAKTVDVKQFIYASSGGVYGKGSQAFQENASIEPPGKLGYYLGSKACGEILVQSYASVFQVIVLRPFFIYGPGQNRNMLIPRLFDNIKTGKPIHLQGKEGIQFNPIHVEDAIKAIKAAIDDNISATYNIAGPEILSIRGICEGIGEFIGKTPNFQKQTGKPSDLIADITAMKERLHVPSKLLIKSLSDVAI